MNRLYTPAVEAFAAGGTAINAGVPRRFRSEPAAASRQLLGRFSGFPAASTRQAAGHTLQIFRVQWHGARTMDRGSGLDLGAKLRALHEQTPEVKVVQFRTVLTDWSSRKGSR